MEETRVRGIDSRFSICIEYWYSILEELAGIENRICGCFGIEYFELDLTFKNRSNKFYSNWSALAATQKLDSLKSMKASFR